MAYLLCTRKILTSLFCLAALSSMGQDSAMHEFKEVQVTGFKEERKTNTSVDIVTMTKDEMRSNGAFNIADGLARIPGVSQLSTGLAVSKPVIRGLYGNRILTLLSGLRFDNQQWQDEHGLGLSDVGVDRVEVIKGPLAILYGTDAVGGILNVIEEKKAAAEKIDLDYNFRFNSNTLGGSSDVGIKANHNNRWWRVRIGGDANPDYSDGAGTRVLNSRFNGVYFKASFGTTHKGWTTENNYNFSRNNFGFLFGDLYSFITPDARYSLSLTNPHHTVMLNILSSQNTKVLKKGLLKLNLGFQSNQRMEDEGGGAISLNMLLSTLQYNLQYIRPLNDKIEMIISHGSSFENNTNLGKRVIIPDANMFETFASAFFKFKVKWLIIEAGAGLDDKYINTLLTRAVNGPDHSIHPFAQNRLAGNGIAGITLNPNSYWNIKLNASSGLRAPNLAELSSNGVHEGTIHYEIGDPNMKNEQNINTDLTISYESKYVRAAVSGFYNQFFNYIYLQPTDAVFAGAYQIYQYKQQNAYLTGGEVEYEITPQGKVKGLTWTQSFAGLIARTSQHDYLPFIAPPKISSTLKYEHGVSKRITNMYGSIGFDYVFKQSNLAPGETVTPAYKLVDASFGLDIAIKRGYIKLSLIGKNLLGEKYYDHLSRLKGYTDYQGRPSVYNIGRNIMLNISIPLSLNYSKK